MRVIIDNSHKYSISAMCGFLDISRSLIYYQPKYKEIDTLLERLIIQVFHSSRKTYGCRKIKVELAKRGYIVSRRRISKIMAKNHLISQYTVKQYKKYKEHSNNSDTLNMIDRQFNNRKLLEVIISDLTYVRVDSSWCYICLIIDLFNREIVGYSCGRHKNASLVEKALLSIKYSLKFIDVFHSDRGKEFDNKLIDDVLTKHSIQRSLSKKGNPYDNAVAEATYKIFKTEFCFNKKFSSLQQLEIELFDYVNWYNNIRIHGSLNYLSPIEYKTVHI